MPVDLDPPAAATPKARLAPQLRRLFQMILPLQLSIYIVVGAVPGVLLPLQIQGIDEASKAANLATVTGIGAIAAMIASPIAGAVSDRTRSRFGRRAPWMVLGALATGLSLIGIGLANGIAQIAIAWVVTQITLNLVISPTTAILPDRVPSARRGAFATLVGVGSMLGNLAGQTAGAALASDLQTGYLVLAGVLIVGVTAFVLLTKDPSSAERERVPFALADFARTFWVDPRRHPDFAWGFTNRLVLFTGFFLIFGFQLYILQDHIGLGDDAVAAVPLLGGVMLVGTLIGASFSGPLSDRVGRRKPFVVFAGVGMALAMIIPFLVPTLTGMIAYTAIASIAFGAYMSVDGALMSEVLPAEADFGKDLGVLNIAATLPQTIAPFLGGAIVVAFGYAALFPVGLILALAGALAVLPIKAVR